MHCTGKLDGNCDGGVYMLGKDTVNVVMRLLECDLETKRENIMAAIDYGHDSVLPQHIKDYRKTLKALDEFQQHVKGMNQ